MSYRSLQNDYLEEEFHRTIDSDSEIIRSMRLIKSIEQFR